MRANTGRGTRARVGLGTLAVLASLGNCSDDGARIAGPVGSRDLAIVSDPEPDAPAAPSLALADLSAATLGVSATHVAFVSLPPGAVPNGATAIIRNRRTGSSVTAFMVAGGFDPVRVQASAGDTLEIAVQRDDGGQHVLIHAVPKSRPPRVVRTVPPRGKTGVPLNASILIVFSEPIDGKTLTGNSLQLFLGATPVAGRLELRSDRLTVELVPEVPFVASTSYRLAVTRGVRDLDNEPLDEALTVEFTTETSGVMSQIAFASSGEIHAMNADGSGVRRLTSGNSDNDPAWSADGTKVAFTRYIDGNNYDLYAVNVDGSNLIRLTSDAAIDYSPAWSPDGRQIAFSSRRGDLLGNGPDIYVMNADGSGVRRLTTSESAQDLAWSPDGTRIAYMGSRRDGASIYVVNVDGTGVTRLTTSDIIEWNPAWSPDGKKIAFSRRGEETPEHPGDGNREIFVINADGSGEAKLSDDATWDMQPSWSPDGRKIAFVSSRGGNGDGIYVMNADGSGVVRLRPLAVDPAWSTTGSVPPALSNLSLRKRAASSGDGQTDSVLSTLSSPLRVLVLQDGVPAPNVVVSWSVHAMQERPGSVSATTTKTDISGIAEVIRTLGPTTGRYRTTASVTGGAGLHSVVTFEAIATPGRPVTISAGHSNSIEDNVLVQVNAPARYPYCVRATDAYGNAAGGVRIDWAVTVGGGSITPARSTTTLTYGCGLFGSVDARHMIGPDEGPHSATASAPELPGAPLVTFTLTAVGALVIVDDIEFTGADVTISSGKTVGWWWDAYPYGAEVHNVTFEDDPAQPVSSATQGPGSTHTRRFSGPPRTIRYRCTNHSTSFAEGMVGTITVK